MGKYNQLERGNMMSVISKVLAVAVAVEFLYIMYLETFAPKSAKTAKVFGLAKADQANEMIITLFKNQGVYNGLIAAEVLLATFVFASQTALIVLLVYIILVAAYGAITSNPKIILMQGGLPILALISLFL